MSYLKAIAEALDSQRHRYLTGGDKGIVKAIARREQPSEDDWEWLTKIVTTVLQKEQEIHPDGVASDQKRENWSKQLAEKPEAELRARLTALTGQGSGPEVLESGTRSTRKAVANEAARNGFQERLAIEDALMIKDKECA